MCYIIGKENKRVNSCRMLFVIVYCLSQLYGNVYVLFGKSFYGSSFAHL